MKILFIVNYYYPYISGVSEYVKIISEKFVEKGYDVTVLASNHEKLKSREVINGVKVIRADIIGKISKGTISLEFFRLAYKLSKKADLVNLHLPMLESGLISKIINKEKLVTMYQCDVNLPNTVFNKFIVKILDISHSICLKNSKIITVTSIDYAEHSRVAYKYRSKLRETAVPVKNYSRIPVIKNNNKKVIGFCGRIVEEKGIDVLLKAFQILLQKRDDIYLVIAGDYEKIAGGSIYPQLIQYIDDNKLMNVEFIGKLPEEKMDEFYSSLDVFVLPSINSLEAFGMVQVEAMFCGTPVVASDLYGVRTIVEKTNMGEVVRRKDANDLAKGIEKILDNPQKYIKPKSEITKYYSTDKCVNDFEMYFKSIVRKNEKNNRVNKI